MATLANGCAISGKVAGGGGHQEEGRGGVGQLGRK